MYKPIQLINIAPTDRWAKSICKVCLKVPRCLVAFNKCDKAVSRMNNRRLQTVHESCPTPWENKGMSNSIRYTLVAKATKLRTKAVEEKNPP